MKIRLGIIQDAFSASPLGAAGRNDWEQLAKAKPLRLAHVKRLGLGLFAAVIGLCMRAVAAPVAATVQEVAKTDQASVYAQLRKIRQTSPDPTVQVAKVAAWLDAHPELKPMPQRPKPSGDPHPPAASRALTGNAALRQQVSSGLRETRALSSDPRQQVKLVAEFLSLNAETFASLKPQPSVDRLSVEQAMSARIRSRIATRPDDVDAQMAEALLEIRQQTDPKEQVRLTAELLRLNKDTINAARAQKLSAQPLKKK